MLTLAQELKQLMLREPRWTVAAAESLTSGHVQALIGSVSGASNYFRGGITAYSLEQKATHLTVDRAEARAVNCVSGKIAEQMARGVAQKFGTTWGVATTGYAEPSPADGVAAPFAWLGFYGLIAGNEILFSKRFECEAMSRVDVQQRVAQEAVRQLVDCVRKAR